MKKLLSSLILVLLLAGLSVAGLNDRFAPLELVDVTSTASEINKLHGVGSGTLVTTTNTVTLTNKTITSPTITGGTTTSASNSGGSFTYATLTTPVIAAIYQDAAKTQLMTLPNTTSDTLVGLAATQQLTNKTLVNGTISGCTTTGVTSTNATITAPTITTPNLTFGVNAVHNYLAAEDWVLSTAEAKTLLLTTSSGSGSANIVAPDVSGTMYIVRASKAGNSITIKKSGGTGITIASARTAIVIHNGSDYVRVTADSAF
jgi:hypothetical protein